MPPVVRWSIIGGGTTGGILVRDGESTKSEQTGRLGTGAVVEQLKLKGDRLQYQLVSGEGPSEGWVSVTLQGKPLAVELREASNGAVNGAVNGAANGAANGDAAKEKEEKTLQDTADDAARRERWATWSPLSAADWPSFPRFGDGGRPLNLSSFKKVVHEQAPGEFWGLEMPLTPKQLEEMGPDWLTKALHRAKTLPEDNRIVKFTQFETKAAATTEKTATEDSSWGGAAVKILLGVEYQRPPQGDEPSTEMFVKMPHEFTGKNERFKVSVTLNGDWAETMFYNMLSGKLPIKTPRIYFSDMNRRTTNFIWVMERIPYGSDWDKPLAVGDFLPPAGKYRDWALGKTAEEMYYAHCKCLARFSGWYYHTAKLTQQVDQCFAPPELREAKKVLHAKMASKSLKERDEFFLQCLADPAMKPLVSSMGIPPEAAVPFLTMGEEFLRKIAPQAFPEKLMEKASLDRCMKEAYEMVRYAQEIGFYQFLIPEYCCLAHPNAQIDNAMFWKGQSGLEAGIIDWGGASFAPLSMTLGGAWLGAEPSFLLQHEEKLLQCFADEYHEVTGVNLDRKLLWQNYKICQAGGIAGCCANVQWCLRLMDKSTWKTIPNRFDKRIDDTFLLRCYFVQVELILALLHERSPYPAFKEWIKRVGLKAKT
ncbi:unnamed protein product [Durusdinium trenchii]|uniref:Uncharacterized protein n=1 Tax=Durusdinium trenchii TaxID=1381693 RepID=A0ABP0PNN5_9DINO